MTRRTVSTLAFLLLFILWLTYYYGYLIDGEIYVAAIQAIRMSFRP